MEEEDPMALFEAPWEGYWFPEPPYWYPEPWGPPL